MPAAGLGLVYETLMTAAADEADAMYGLIAESAALAPDRSSVTFTLRPEARWSDGAPITAEDVVFSFEKAKNPGGPEWDLRIIQLRMSEQEWEARQKEREAAHAKREAERTKRMGETAGASEE